MACTALYILGVYTARSVDREHPALVHDGVFIAREIAIGILECCPALVTISRDRKKASVSHPNDEVAAGVRRRLAHNDPIEGATGQDDGVGGYGDRQQLNFRACVWVEELGVVVVVDDGEPGVLGSNPPLIPHIHERPKWDR